MADLGFGNVPGQQLAGKLILARHQTYTVVNPQPYDRVDRKPGGHKLPDIARSKNRPVVLQNARDHLDQLSMGRRQRT